jgi:Tfp pilus assembly protein FimT
MMANKPVVEPFREAGFSLVETGLVLSLMTIIAGFALVSMPAILPGMRADAALNQTVAQLRSGRELAVAQRRNIELRFLGNRQIQLVRRDVPAGTTVLSTLELENNIEFLLFDGIPDSPDSFGNSSPVDFSGAALLIFLSDGTLVNNQGDPVSGSVFLGLANRRETARAVTILGATGRVRGYRWTGTFWTQQ